MPMRDTKRLFDLRNLGFALLVFNLLIFPRLTMADEVDFRKEVLTAIEKFAKTPRKEHVLEGLRSSLPNFYLISASKTLDEARSDMFLANSNRVSVAFITNQQSQVFFIRPDLWISTPIPHRRSSSPIIVIASGGKLNVFDTKTIDEFSEDVYSFHGFISGKKPVPSLVASIGPVGSGNMFWFYRFDFDVQPDLTVKTSSHLLVDEAHVVNFVVDLKRLSVSVNYYRDKWDGDSSTNRTVSLISEESKKR